MADFTEERISTGVSGLDQICNGGLLPQHAYLVRGGPGAGKTTLGLHFLTSGTARGESALYISLYEPEQRIREIARRLGFPLEQVQFLSLGPVPDLFSTMEPGRIFAPTTEEPGSFTQRIGEEITRLKPQRIFVDAITQFRFLYPDIFQFRRQMLSFLHFLTEQEVTALLSSETSAQTVDEDLQFMTDGVITLEQSGTERWLSISKFVGSGFRAGRHAMKLTNTGMLVFPRLLPEEHGKVFKAETIPSGVPELDEMLHGGIERGTVTLITGPSGVGKTTLGLQYMKEASGRGERSVTYIFEESLETLVHRAEAIQIPVTAMMERGTLAVVPIDPLRLSPDEFAMLVRQEVEECNTRIIMLDSIAGYRLAFREENLVTHMHALAKYLTNMGVTVVLVNEVEYITGNFRITDVGISYLVDNVIFLRYLEMRGEIHKAIGVLKKRMSSFEKTLREIEITRYGIKVGRPLTELRGILTGTPEIIGRREDATACGESLRER